MDQNTQLLQQIADNTGHSDSMWVAIIAGSAGVFGAGLTALLSYLATNKSQQFEEKRLRASIITTERLRWLQELRERLAKFYAKLDLQYNFLKRHVPTTPEEKNEFQKQLDEFSNEVNEQCNIITLMMNPANPDQNNLKAAVQNAIAFVSQCFQIRNTVVSGNAGTIFPLSPPEIPFNNDDYRKIKTEAFDSLTKIGIETWGQIKELK